MKSVIRKSMKEMLAKLLIDFRNEPDKDLAQIEHYAEKFVEDFERYLTAYHEFKEDK